jgi:hypothetical protein
VSAVIEPRTDSALALTTLSPGGDAVSLTDPEVDSLLFVSSGSGSLTVAGTGVDLKAGMAALVLAGEEAEIRGELELVRVTAGRASDLHAPLGRRELVFRVDSGRTRQALDARGYQVLFGPHNGSVRATLFVGFRTLALALPPLRRDRLDSRGTGRSPPSGACVAGPARSRICVPASSPRGPHRRELERRQRDDPARRVHSGRQHVGGVPRRRLTERPRQPAAVTSRASASTDRGDPQACSTSRSHLIDSPGA